MEKYVTQAKELGMLNAKLITPGDIHFDIRTMLKCKWGCDKSRYKENLKCDDRGTTLQERIDMIKSYKHILILHSNDAHQLSKTVLEIERSAFLDGYYLAATIRACALCKKCHVLTGEPCPTPEKIRPCDQLFGIDMFKTARGLGLPLEVLTDRNQTPNRYGLVLIE